MFCKVASDANADAGHGTRSSGVVEQVDAQTLAVALKAPEHDFTAINAKGSTFVGEIGTNLLRKGSGVGGLTLRILRRSKENVQCELGVGLGYNAEHQVLTCH